MEYNGPKVTHLSKLPIDSITADISQGGGDGLRQPRGPGPVDTTYKPPDIHPNPYGIGPKQPDLDFKQHLDMGMPANDIPIAPLPHMIDETLQPNYIPPPPYFAQQDDYIRKYEQKLSPDTETALRDHKSKKYRGNKWQVMMDALQLPVLVGLLFFIFHLPSTQNLLFKQIGFLPIMRDDGQFNIYGLVLFSFLFGGCIYGFTQVVDFIGSD